MIRWQTPDGEAAEVWVVRNDGSESLFASGSTGTEVADWITTGSVYEFRLYAMGPPRRMLAAIQVTPRDDAYVVIELTVVGLLAFALIIILCARKKRVSWLVEAGFPALILGALWVKLTYIATSLRPNWGFIPPERQVITATLSVLIFCWAALMVINFRRRAIAAVVLALVLTTVGVADLVHARFFDDVITVTEFSAAPQLLSVTSSVRALLNPADGLYYVDCLLLVLVLPVFLGLATRVEPVSRKASLLLAAVLLSISVAVGIPAFHMIRQPDFPNFFSRRGVVAEIGVLAYHVNDIAVAIGSAISRQVSVSDQDRDEVLRWVEKHQTRKERLSPLFGAARGRNLILISAESLNAFPLGLTLRGQRITPHLDKLAAESLHFTNFFDQAHLGTTSDGETLALESLYPLPDGPVATRFPTNDFLGLPTILSRHSYHTLSAVAATAETWNMGQMHPRHGIMRSYFERDFVASERVNGWIADHVFFQQILPLLKKQPQPFMAFLLSGSSHFPYELPASLRTLPVGQLEGTLLGRYLQAVHYFDGAIGQFVQGLRDSGLLEQSVVAIYGDHHGYLDDPAAIARLLGATPDDILSRWRSRKLVPFLVRLPRGEAAGTRTVTGGHLDIAPTLLALLGIDMAGTAMLGLDLTLGEEQLVVFRDGSFVNSQGYYLNQPGFPICFDSTGTGVDCGAFSASRREALERLRVSDAMIHGNLISHFLQFTENDR